MLIIALMTPLLFVSLYGDAEDEPDWSLMIEVDRRILRAVNMSSGASVVKRMSNLLDPCSPRFVKVLRRPTSRPSSIAACESAGLFAIVVRYVTLEPVRV